MNSSESEGGNATGRDAFAVLGFMGAAAINFPTLVGGMPVELKILVLIIALAAITWAALQYVTPRRKLLTILGSGFVGLALASIPGNLLDPLNRVASRYDNDICRLGLLLEIGDRFENEQRQLPDNPHMPKGSKSSYYVSARGHAFKCRAYPDGTIKWSARDETERLTARGVITITANARWRIEDDFIIVESFLRNGKFFGGYKLKMS